MSSAFALEPSDTPPLPAAASLPRLAPGLLGVAPPAPEPKVAVVVASAPFEWNVVIDVIDMRLPQQTAVNTHGLLGYLYAFSGLHPP